MANIRLFREIIKENSKNLIMEGKEISKARFFCECLLEKCMEFIDNIRYGINRNREWTSNLIEYYCINEDYIDKQFVQEFLENRRKILNNNRYKMVVKKLPKGEEENVIGKVMLYRKRHYIHEAKLKLKGEKEERMPLIFWSFEKTEN